jgi:hypothetical protein
MNDVRTCEEFPWSKTTGSGKALDAWRSIIVRNSPSPGGGSTKRLGICASAKVLRTFQDHPSLLDFLFLTHPDFDSMVVISSDLSLIPFTDWT